MTAPFNPSWADQNGRRLEQVCLDPQMNEMLAQFFRLFINEPTDKPEINIAGISAYGSFFFIANVSIVREVSTPSKEAGFIVVKHVREICLEFTMQGFAYIVPDAQDPHKFFTFTSLDELIAFLRNKVTVGDTSRHIFDNNPHVPTPLLARRLIFETL